MPLSEMPPHSPNPSNGWNEYKRLVVAELGRLDKNICLLKNDIDDIKEILIGLKVKMGFIGAIAGIIAGGMMSLIVKLIVR